MTYGVIKRSHAGEACKERDRLRTRCEMKEGPGVSIDPDRVLIKPVKLAEVESRLRDVWMSTSSGPPG